MKHLRKFENFYLPEEEDDRIEKEEDLEKEIDESDDIDDLTPEGDEN